MFQHARTSGAHVFDAIRVNDIHFSPYDPADPHPPPPPSTDAKPNVDANSKDYTRLRPSSVTYTHKPSGTTGNITFTYLIDASGRTGLLSTKYLKTRRYNQGLKNVASWGYWKGAGKYALGDERREGSPFFEAMTDESGWIWGIPLHDGTVSVGVVQNQDMATAKKKALAEKEKSEGEKEMSASERFYRSQLPLAPNLSELLKNATLASEVHNASDYSYSANPLLSPSVSPLLTALSL